MRRRGFIAGLLLATATRLLRAQEPVKQHRIAIVITAGPLTGASETGHPLLAGVFSTGSAGAAMSRDRTSRSSGFPARGSPATTIFFARSSTGTRT